MDIRENEGMDARMGQSRSTVDWGKATLIAGLANGLILVLLFYVPDWLSVPFFVLLLPGMLIVFPVILAQFHSVWGGYIILGFIANWIIYTLPLYWLMKRRRAKRERMLGGVTNT